jgi:hypothetical protein
MSPELVAAVLASAAVPARLRLEQADGSSAAPRIATSEI